MRIHKITERHHEDASGIAFEMFSSIRIIVAFGAEAKLARQHEEFLNKVCMLGLHKSVLLLYPDLFFISKADRSSIVRLLIMRRELLH